MGAVFLILAQVVLLVLWYAVPEFAHLSAWIIWMPTIIVGLIWAFIFGIFLISRMG
jgi:hypothetical protein